MRVTPKGLLLLAGPKMMLFVHYSAKEHVKAMATSANLAAGRGVDLRLGNST